MYEHKVLSSGREVDVRPMSWEEFWELGRLRLEAAGRTDDATVLFDASREIRNRSLSACVQNWDAMRNEMSLPEVVELERIIEDISKLAVSEGNSSRAADGQETADA